VETGGWGKRTDSSEERIIRHLFYSTEKHPRQGAKGKTRELHFSNQREKIKEGESRKYK